MKYVNPLFKCYDNSGRLTSVVSADNAANEEIKLTDGSGVFFCLRSARRKDGLFNLALSVKCR